MMAHLHRVIYVKSFRILNGDISFNELGKIELVDDEDNSLIIQSINLKLKTLKEDLFYNENYGYPLLKGKITQDIMEDFLNETIAKDDERIALITIIYFNERTGKLNRGIYDTTFNVELANGEIIQLQTEIKTDTEV